jgi:CelD/BcsL family acetyltransferase involved in cellulose biosynthesis
MLRLELELITEIERLQELRLSWAALCDECHAATPFQSPEWLLPWWRHLGGGELMVLAVRGGGRLLGLAPFFRCVYRNRRQISSLGIGISDYLDVLMCPEVEEEGMREVWRYLIDNAGEWDVCDFQELRADSPLLRDPDFHVLRDLGPSCAFRVSVRTEALDGCVVLELPATVEAFRGVLSPHQRRNLRRARALLEQGGGELRFLRADHETWPDLLDALYTLHTARWQAREQPGMLSPLDVRAFHRAAAAGLRAAGRLRLYGLLRDGRMCAALYNFIWKDRVYAYLGGFDPVWSQASPGTLLTDYAIEESIRDGFREYDFLRGREAHKYTWGARDRSGVRLLITKERVDA